MTETHDPGHLFEMSRDRRAFMKRAAVGAAGLALAPAIPAANSDIVRGTSDTSEVSFVTGDDRRDMMHRVLKPLESKIGEAVGDRQVVVKVNLVGPDSLCGTHVDAVRGTLDILQPLTDRKIVIGDSTGRTYPGPVGTRKHYETHGYFALPKEYNAKLIDLNDRPTQRRWILGGKGHPLGINIIDTFLDPDIYLVSLTRMKTHSDVVATLSIKNIVMGSPISHYRQRTAEGRNEKSFMHSGGVKNINFNIFLLAKEILPDLAIVDGLVGMEGNGPTLGTPIGHGVALAGFDALSVDRIGVTLMGIDFDDVGYLSYCAQAGLGRADLSSIHVSGPDYLSHIKPYRLHENIDWQLKWKEGMAVDRG